MNADRAALASHTVYFAFDSAAVKKSEQENLQAVADALSKDSSAKLLIEGHCDERGTEEYNRSLGERRALALREALAKLGVDPSRIRTISYGKDHPADPATTNPPGRKTAAANLFCCIPSPALNCRETFEIIQGPHCCGPFYSHRAPSPDRVAESGAVSDAPGETADINICGFTIGRDGRSL